MIDVLQSLAIALLAIAVILQQRTLRRLRRDHRALRRDHHEALVWYDARWALARRAKTAGLVLTTSPDAGVAR